jgi:hypothetical protein
MKNLTALVTSGNDKGNKMIKSAAYSTKKEFKTALIQNGYNHVRIYTDEDLAVQEGGDFETAAQYKKWNKRYNAE